MPENSGSIAQINDDSLESLPSVATRVLTGWWENLRRPDPHVESWLTTTQVQSTMEPTWPFGLCWQESRIPAITIKCTEVTANDTFVYSIKHYQKSKKIDYAIELIYERIDTMLKNQSFSECDDLIGKIRPSSISPQLGITVLMATISIKEKLNNRKYLSSLYRTALMAEQPVEEVDSIFKFVE